MKKFLKKSTALFLATALFVPTVFLFNGQSYANSVTYYTPEEIKSIAERSLNNGIPDLPRKGEITPNADSFLVKEYTGFNPSYITKNDEAFEIAHFAFDTRGKEASSQKLTVKYERSTSVEWAVSGSASLEVGTSAFWGFIEPKVTATASVARTSSTSNAIGAQMEYTVPKNKLGYVKMYAGGIGTGGALTYKWRDRTGRTGTGAESINAKIPYKSYSTLHIKFGRLTYTN